MLAGTAHVRCRPLLDQHEITSICPAFSQLGTENTHCRIHGSWSSLINSRSTAGAARGWPQQCLPVPLPRCLPARRSRAAPEPGRKYLPQRDRVQLGTSSGPPSVSIRRAHSPTPIERFCLPGYPYCSPHRCQEEEPFGGFPFVLRRPRKSQPISSGVGNGHRRDAKRLKFQPVNGLKRRPVICRLGDFPICCRHSSLEE